MDNEAERAKRGSLGRLESRSEYFQGLNPRRVFKLFIHRYHRGTRSQQVRTFTHTYSIRQRFEKLLRAISGAQALATAHACSAAHNPTTEAVSLMPCLAYQTELAHRRTFIIPAMALVNGSLSKLGSRAHCQWRRPVLIRKYKIGYMGQLTSDKQEPTPLCGISNQESIHFPNFLSSIAHGAHAPGTSLLSH